MILKEFLLNFVEPNSIVRLLYRNETGHVTVFEGWDVVYMDWQYVNNEDEKFLKFLFKNVIGVTDIACGSMYPEAINICIEA